MIISTDKIKTMTISKESIRCKLVDNKIIEQVMKFIYLDVELSSYGDLDYEIRYQVNKANKISDWLYDIIWRNKHLNIEVKSRIYKTVIRPILRVV